MAGFQSKNPCLAARPAGSFPIRETEWYFGLRIRHCPPYHPDPHKRKPKPPMNIPVNVTVGPYGAQGT